MSSPVEMLDGAFLDGLRERRASARLPYLRALHQAITDHLIEQAAELGIPLQFVAPDARVGWEHRRKCLPCWRLAAAQTRLGGQSPVERYRELLWVRHEHGRTCPEAS